MSFPEVLDDACNQTFAAVLAIALEEGTPKENPTQAVENLTSPHLAEALERVRVALPMADNMGETGDDRDLFRLIDVLGQAATRAYPESLCRSGCSGCCQYPAALFTATRKEWERIASFIATTWVDDALNSFVKRFWDSHGSYINRLRAVEWLMEFPLPVYAKREAIPLACPFLVDDRCSVYAARPVYCRSFGLFTFKYWWEPHSAIYACDMQVEHLAPYTRTPGRPALPSFNPLLIKRYALSGMGRRRTVAMWIARTWPRSWLKKRLKDTGS